MNPFLYPTLARPDARCGALSWRSGRKLPRASRGGGLRRGASAVALALGLAASGEVLAVDVNAATADQLDGLKGIGPKTASLIVAERTRGGPFESLQDLGERVRGLGPKRLKDLHAAGLVAGAPPAGKPTAPAPRK